MDDLQLGIRIRAARVRRGWTQKDLGRRARVSDQTVSRLERGHAGRVVLDRLRAVAAALEIRVELHARARAGDLERMVNAAHAELAEAVTAHLIRLGWEVRPEVSFSVFGERGVIDLLAWHAATRTLLVIELKTAIVDIGELLATLGRKTRLGPEAARDLGWSPARVACWLVVAEGMTNRRRAAAHSATLRAAFPDRGPSIRAWLRHPDRVVRAMSFFSARRAGSVRGPAAPLRRVRPPRARTG